MCLIYGNNCTGNDKKYAFLCKMCNQEICSECLLNYIQTKLKYNPDTDYELQFPKNLDEIPCPYCRNNYNYSDFENDKNISPELQNFKIQLARNLWYQKNIEVRLKIKQNYNAIKSIKIQNVTDNSKIIPLNSKFYHHTATKIHSSVNFLDYLEDYINNYSCTRSFDQIVQKFIMKHNVKIFDYLEKLSKKLDKNLLIPASKTDIIFVRFSPILFKHFPQNFKSIELFTSEKYIFMKNVSHIQQRASLCSIFVMDNLDPEIIKDIYHEQLTNILPPLQEEEIKNFMEMDEFVNIP